MIGCYLSLEIPTTDFHDPRGDLKLYEFLRGIKYTNLIPIRYIIINHRRYLYNVFIDGVLCDPKNIPPSRTNPNSFTQFSINGKLYLFITI